MRKLLTILLLLLLPFRTLGLGEWSIYNGTGTYRQLAHLGTKLYTLCGHSIYWYDTESEERGALSIQNGLSGSNVAYLAASDERLCVVYADGLIDVITTDNKLYDIIDLQAATINGSRTINGVKVCGDDLFLACDFGVLAFDLTDCSLSYSYATPDPAMLAFASQGMLYYSSQQQGLMTCPASSNYADRNLWHQVQEKPLVDATTFTDANGREQCWFTDERRVICSLDSLGASHSMNLWNNQKLIASEPYLFGSGWGVQIYRQQNGKYEQCNLHTGPFNSCTGYYAASDSIIYILHKNQGLQRMHFTFVAGGDGQYEVEEQVTEVMNYTEWHGDKLVDLEFDSEGTLYAFNGGQMRADGYTAMTTSQSLINTFANDRWSVITEDSILNQLRALDPTVPDGYYRGLTDLVCDPTTPGRIYLGTLRHGLYVIEDGKLEGRYDAQNTPGGPCPVSYDTTLTQLSALAFDANGNLWTGYTYADCPLAVRTPDGKWQRHPLTSDNAVSNVGRIIPYNVSGKTTGSPLIWVAHNAGYEKCQVNVLRNADAASTTDDESISFRTLIDQDSKQISPYYIFDLCEDLEGKIWILTSNGPFVVEDPYETFKYGLSNPGLGKVRRIKIPRNDGTNLADYLMEEVWTNCMVVDNYNRKWIGTTNNGLYLLSADCITEMEHFTADNSLLPSDNIIALGYDRDSNRLFISTDNGLACYQTDDLKGESSFGNLYCYPNPVRPEYSGELRIMGLMENSTVSVTTASGDLLFRTTSQGATATWNLRTASGSRVDPGIYLIHGVNADGKEGAICKCLVL